MKEVKMDQDSISWGELAELTHTTQVERFGFCTCEDNEGNENPYTDCPKSEAQEKAFNRAIIGEVLSQGANPITVISIMARYLTAHEAESVANEVRLEL